MNSKYTAFGPTTLAILVEVATTKKISRETLDFLGPGGLQEKIDQDVIIEHNGKWLVRPKGRRMLKAAYKLLSSSIVSLV